MELPGIKDQVLRALHELTNPPRVSDLSKHLDDSEIAIEEALDQLEQEGRVARTRKGRYTLPETVGLMGGTFLGNARGFGFFRPTAGGNDLFIGSDDQRGALHGDTVLARVKRKGGERQAGVIEKVVYRRNVEIIGTFEQDERGSRVVPDDGRLTGDFLIKEKYGKGTKGAGTGDKVVYHVIDWPDGNGPFRGRISEIIGGADDAGAEISAILRRHDIVESFTRKASVEADALPDRVRLDELAGREDFRKQNCFTIDGAHSKDFDDAVAIESLGNGFYRLYVHIADVTHYVEDGSGIDHDAFARGTSVYLCDRVVPMLPKALSNGICSLNPNVDRLCLSCVMDIDPRDGSVSDYRIVKGVMHSKARLFYEEVNALLEDDDAAMAEKMRGQLDDLKKMELLQRVLYVRRRLRGSIDFEIPEAEIELDSEGVPVRIEAAHRGIANRMIEEFMLLANETVATHALLMDIPFLYRVHETPDDDKIADYSRFVQTLGYSLRVGKKGIIPMDVQKMLAQAREKPEERLLNKLMLRAMQRARYAPDNLGHFGLALTNYCHFTSPIRRYPDLFIHRVLKLQLDAKLDMDAVTRLSARAEEAAKQSSERERAAAEAEREADQLMMARYMVNHIGEEFDGVIDGVSDFGIFVELPNTISGMVPVSSLTERYMYMEEQHALIGPGKKRYRMGDPVRVRVVSASPDSRRIDFEMVDPA